MSHDNINTLLETLCINRFIGRRRLKVGRHVARVDQRLAAQGQRLSVALIAQDVLYEAVRMLIVNQGCRAVLIDCPAAVGGDFAMLKSPSTEAPTRDSHFAGVYPMI